MTIHPHPDLERLGRVLTEDSAFSQCDTPLVPRQIVVPSKHLADWLQIYIARKRGVCMGLKFWLPRDFVNNVANAIHHQEIACGTPHPWARENLVWHLLPLIPEWAPHLGMKNVVSGSRDALALANTVADRLDQYGHFRGDWLEKWSRNQPAFTVSQDDPISHHEAWQRALWRKLSEQIDCPHPALSLLCTSLSKSEKKKLSDEFSSLTVIGSGSLDPLLIGALKQLESAGCSISVHLVLPSLQYLGELRKQDAQSHFSKEQSPEDLDLMETHPLLVSLGRQAVGTFLMAGELDEQYDGWDAMPDTDGNDQTNSSLLARLQSDIRALNSPVPAEETMGNDSSVSVHACHGPRREMEVLRDELLRAFCELRNLKPEEIIIVTPSLEAYAPLASSVLAKGVGRTALPVRVAETPPSAQPAVVEGWIALLRFLQGRMTASEMIELSRVRAAYPRLGVVGDESKLSVLAGWIRSSGWTEGERRGRQALDRLIAGHWLGSEQEACGSCGDFLLPVSEDLYGDTELKQKFLQWLLDLQTVLEEWHSPAKPSVWAARLRDAAQKLFDAPEKKDAPRSEDQFPHFFSFLENIVSGVEIPSGTLLDWIESEAAESRRKGVMGGGISFGRFKQLQHFPCRVLAMVGMQEAAFPSQSRTQSWDLMNAYPRVWDRNSRTDDKQLFLDALLAPSERLIIIGSTRNAHTGKDEPFSACVDELLRTLDRMTANGQTPPSRKIFKHRILPFAPDYFQDDSGLPRSFDTQAAAAAGAVCSGNTGTRKGLPLFTQNAGGSGLGTENSGVATEQITLRQLVEFWKNPAKSFLKANEIAIPMEEDDDESLDRLPLKLGGLGAWKVKDAILEDAIRKKLSARTLAGMDADRFLPPQKLGVETFKKHELPTLALAEKISAIIGSTPALKVSVKLNDSASQCEISGELAQGVHGGKTVLLYYRAGKIDDAKDWTEPWINALVVAAAGHNMESCILSENFPETKCLPAFTEETARKILDILLSGFLQGMTRPLCYAPKTSEEFLKLEGKGKMSWEKLCAKWFAEGRDGMMGGEGTELSAQIAWRDTNPFSEEFQPEWATWVKQVAKPIFAWQSEEDDSRDDAPEQATKTVTGKRGRTQKAKGGA